MKKHLKLGLSSLIMLSMLFTNSPFVLYATDAEGTSDVEEVTENVETDATEQNETIEQNGDKVKDIFMDADFAQAIADIYTGGDVDAILTTEKIEATTELHVKSEIHFQSLAGVEVFKNIETFTLTVLNSSPEDQDVIAEIPDTFTSLTKLKHISFTDVSLAEFPKVFLQMPQIETLRFEDVPISSIPDDISALVNLQELSIIGGYISELPDSLFQLPSLRALALIAQELETMPDAIYSIPNLETLDISVNKKLGKISPSIANAKNLKIFNAKYCALQTLPIEITQLESLTVIGLDQNHIFNIPLEIYQFVTARGEVGNFEQVIFEGHEYFGDTPFIEGEEIKFNMYPIEENRIHDIVPSIVTEVTVKKMPIIDGEPSDEHSVEVEAEYHYKDGHLIITSLPKLEDEKEFYTADVKMYDSNGTTHANPWRNRVKYMFAVTQKDATAVTPTKDTKKSPSTGDSTTVLPVAIAGLAALGTILKLRKK